MLLSHVFTPRPPHPRCHCPRTSTSTDTLYRSGGQFPEVFLRGAGVPEEAVAAFKRVLIHNPDFLETHLILAILYTAFGWEVEARAEVAEALRINPNFFLQEISMVWQADLSKNQEGLERLLGGLRNAGLR